MIESDVKSQRIETLHLMSIVIKVDITENSTSMVFSVLEVTDLQDQRLTCFIEQVKESCDGENVRVEDSNARVKDNILYTMIRTIVCILFFIVPFIVNSGLVGVLVSYMAVEQLYTRVVDIDCLLYTSPSPRD